MQGSLLTDIGEAINRYFAWMASGPRWRYGIGIGGPLVVLFVLYRLVSGGGGDEPSELAVALSPTAISTQRTTTQQGSAAAPAAATTQTNRTTTPGAAGTAATSTTGTPRASTTPAATVAPGGTYVVKSGDTLGAICSTNVASMSTNSCVDAIVQLNKLANAASLQIGQQLTLPGGTPGAVNVVTPAPSATASNAPATATQPAATATRVP